MYRPEQSRRTWRDMKNGKKPVSVGIAGGSGSGKSFLVRELARAIGEERLSILPHDSYYRDRSGITPEERKKLNYDHPGALETSLLTGHLEDLRGGKPIEMPVYDFRTHCRMNETKTVQPKELILIEGILVLSDPDLLRKLDIKIFVDLDEDLLLARRIERDVSERGRTVSESIRQYRETTRPMYRKYVLPSREHADIVLPGKDLSEHPSVKLLASALVSLSTDYPQFRN